MAYRPDWCARHFSKNLFWDKADVVIPYHSLLCMYHGDVLAFRALLPQSLVIQHADVTVRRGSQSHCATVIANSHNSRTSAATGSRVGGRTAGTAAADAGRSR